MSDSSLHHLFQRARDGDQEAIHAAIEVMYAELRAMAGNLMRGERPGHTLQPTALVGEACARLLGHVAVEGRREFLGLAATVMRRVLVDHARRLRADKRGGGVRKVTLDSDVTAPGEGQAVDLVALDTAMSRLALLDERQARIVEMRYLAGMTVAEVGETLGLSRSTIEAEWRAARAWLRRELERA